MGNFLKDNQKTNIRFQDGDFTFYEPTKEQYSELIKMIEENSNIDNDLSIQAEIGIKFIRHIIKELTTMGNEIDEISDEELSNLLDNGNRKVIKLYREIEKLINELLEDIQYNSEQQINMVNSFINILNANDKKEKLEQKMNRFLKKYKIKLTLQELTELSELSKSNPMSPRIKELLEKAK